MEHCDRKGFFDENAGKWDEITVHDLDIVNMLADSIGMEGHETVLDIGTGTGIMIPFYRERTDGAVTALDYSEKMIEVARRKYPESEYGVEYVVSDLYEYDPGKRFDVVVCYCCFPHFPRKQEAVDHLVSLLLPGGKLMIAHGSSRHHINMVHHEAGESVKHDMLPDMETMEGMMRSSGLDVVLEMDDERTFTIMGVKHRSLALVDATADSGHVGFR